MAQRKFSDLTKAAQINKGDVLVLEQTDGTKQALFEEICKAIFTPEIVEQTKEFPEILQNDTLSVIAGKVKKWQQDALKKIEQSQGANMIQSFPTSEFNPEDPEDETTKQLKDEIISALLAYTMNEKIMKVVSDHGELAADYAILKREQMASYGYYGAEWNIEDLMTLVKAGKWDKFAVGDYFIETNTAGEKILFEIAGKNSYLHCGSTELRNPHIVVSPRDCLETYYKYNSSNKNAGGYAASLMPSNLETEANKFTSKLQGYMTSIKRMENNKGTATWESRRIFLPGNPELFGFHGSSDMWDGGAFNQLPLFVGGNAHLLKGAGFNKSKTTRIWYWTAEPSCADTTDFCFFNRYGACGTNYASEEGGISPLIVLS